MVCSSCCCFRLAASIWDWRSLRCRKYLSFSDVDLSLAADTAASACSRFVRICSSTTRVMVLWSSICFPSWWVIWDTETWVCTLLSIQNTTYAGETCYRLPFDHTASCKTNVEKQKRKSFNEVVVFGFSPPKQRVETWTFLLITLTLFCITDYKIFEVGRTPLQIPNIPFS